MLDPVKASRWTDEWFHNQFTKFHFPATKVYDECANLRPAGFDVLSFNSCIHAEAADSVPPTSCLYVRGLQGEGARGKRF